MLGTVHCALCCLGWSGLARRAGYAIVLSHAIDRMEVNDGRGENVGLMRWRESQDLSLVWARVKADLTCRSPCYSVATTHTGCHTTKMALVNYSDSEGSDAETAPAAPTPKAAPPAKPKLINRTESKKIKVDLPTIRPEPGQSESSEPAPKRARTAGAFSGFNSLLPAPKRTGQNAPKAGVSLKTSSEAAFSRTPAPKLAESEDVGESEVGNASRLPDVVPEDKKEEPKLVGKTTRFMPLSVANAKKKKKPNITPKTAVVEGEKKAAPVEAGAKSAPTDTPPAEPAKTKPKASLFSFSGTEDTAPTEKPSGAYEPEFAAAPADTLDATTATQPSTAASSAPNDLTTVANDLNLTASERRQLFGRTGQAPANITHFNMDAEYRSNQEMAAAGETFEHRAVKAIAPGKHSLTQLVNNVKSQSEALEDKWADGRRNRGEGGSKYGW